LKNTNLNIRNHIKESFSEVQTVDTGKKVIIVGAGLGGLAVALRLVRYGYQIHIIEKNQTAGGRLNRLTKDGFTWDMGPTFFSMSYEFDDFLKETGIIDAFEFEELNPLYTVNFSGTGKTYTIFKDLKKLAYEFRDIEPEFELKMRKFLDRTGQLFHETECLILKQNYDSLFDYLRQLFKVHPRHAPLLIRSYWKELASQFESREVREIFSLVAFFLGGTPFDTSAVYTLLNYVELKHNGYHNVKGGMYRIVEFLLKQIKKAGISISYNTEIVDTLRIDKRIKAMVDQNRNAWHADLFVINSDAALFRGRVLRRRKFNETSLKKMRWTMAPFTIYLGVKGKVKTLEQHNYFLGDDMKDYASRVFTDQPDLSKPYYYVNVPSKNNPDSAPAGCESIYILCPVPHLLMKTDWKDKDAFKESIIHDLSKRINYNLQENIISQTVMTPVEWERAFNLYKGSGLGLAHNLNQMAALRPRNIDEKYENLFYVGASTVPGTGLPMVMISSKLVLNRILSKYGSVRQGIS
jgi:phytoene desaturase